MPQTWIIRKLASKNPPIDATETTGNKFISSWNCAKQRYDEVRITTWCHSKEYFAIKGNLTWNEGSSDGRKKVIKQITNEKVNSLIASMGKLTPVEQRLVLSLLDGNE